MQEGGRGEGGPEGRGEGGPREHGPRPLFGTITSVDAHSITIKPEHPDFLKDLRPGGPEGDRGPEGGRGAGKEPRELPAQLTIDIVGTTKYFRNDSEVQGNPFKAGDKVAIMPAEGSEGRDITARAVTDYATAEARMKQRMKDGGPRGEGKGKGKGQGRGQGQGRGE
jgi:hypothetical protein